MEVSPRRRLTIADALVLVAAAGGGFAFARVWLDRYRQLNGNPLVGYEIFIITTCWAALAISIALIPLRLWRPRPRWQILRWQPGLVACFAVLLALAFGTFTYLPTIVRTPAGVTFWLQSVVMPSHIGPIVIATWLVLVIGNRWRSEASWIDRTGRALGFFWIALYVLLTLALFWM